MVLLKQKKNKIKNQESGFIAARIVTSSLIVSANSSLIQPLTSSMKNAIFGKGKKVDFFRI